MQACACECACIDLNFRMCVHGDPEPFRNVHLLASSSHKLVNSARHAGEGLVVVVEDEALLDMRCHEIRTMGWISVLSQSMQARDLLSSFISSKPSHKVRGTPPTGIGRGICLLLWNMQRESNTLRCAKDDRTLAPLRRSATP